MENEVVRLSQNFLVKWIAQFDYSCETSGFSMQIVNGLDLEKKNPSILRQ